jgi:hypothetical protein
MIDFPGHIQAEKMIRQGVKDCFCSEKRHNPRPQQPAICPETRGETPNKENRSSTSGVAMTRVPWGDPFQ